MLENIKSSFILKQIFTHLNDLKQLKLVKYNKGFQNKLNLSIYNYELFKGTYIIFLEDGKIEEYKDDQLIYEGGFMNGERNGIGKEYDYNKQLIFEGEYLEGRKNGKEKEYYYFHRLKFEGEYLNNKRWNGKGYDENGNIIYELNNGSGKIIEYHGNHRLKFEGEYLNGERNGKGKEYWSTKI